MQLDRTYQNLWLIGNDNRLFPQIDGVENIEFDQKKQYWFWRNKWTKKRLGITLAKNPNQPQTVIAIFNQLVTAN